MKFKLTTLACILGMAFGSSAIAATEAASDIKKLRSEVDALNAKAKEWEEWKAPKTLVHLSGFANVDYTQVDGKPGSFGTGGFSPIFHYQFADKVMLEAELEFESDADGKSEAAIGYMTIDYFVNDSAAIVMGKFLSPLGQFRQNLHPSWINKMASAPVGFGHDQAAPNADVGFMLRGGFTSDSGSQNYAVYVANGPTLEQSGGEIEMIETPGLNADNDGKKVIGGRYGVFIVDQQLDIGFSAAVGGTSARSGSAPSYTYETSTRSYNVVGFDLGWRVAGFNIKAEYIKQTIGDDAASAGTEGGSWAAWYTQASYKIGGTDWELVGRLSSYDTPHTATDRNQAAIGLNYVYASNVVTKLNYEKNTNPNAGQTADNRLLVQLAYGF